jgi:hypothetical protein
MKTGWPTVLLSIIAEPASRPVAESRGKQSRSMGVNWWGEAASERQTTDDSQAAAELDALLPSILDKAFTGAL